jgi:hypothetical protein
MYMFLLKKNGTSRSSRSGSVTLGFELPTALGAVPFSTGCLSLSLSAAVAEGLAGRLRHVGGVPAAALLCRWLPLPVLRLPSLSEAQCSRLVAHTVPADAWAPMVRSSPMSPAAARVGASLASTGAARRRFLRCDWLNGRSPSDACNTFARPRRRDLCSFSFWLVPWAMS